MHLDFNNSPRSHHFIYGVILEESAQEKDLGVITHITPCGGINGFKHQYPIHNKQNLMLDCKQFIYCSYKGEFVMINNSEGT